MTSDTKVLESSQARSLLMSKVRMKNTQPELWLRKRLHSAGFRYRLHVARLPGTPDIVFPGLRAVIFVNGCFWHGHDCYRFSWPKARAEYWKAKITRNKQRDSIVQEALRAANWRVGVVWACSLAGKSRMREEAIVAECRRWLRSDEPFFSLSWKATAT